MMASSEYFHRIAALFLAAWSGQALALTSGPNLPEYTNFESVEATDLVNLSSGAFTWTLPVMTVPGPGLGFPIVLSYHANSNQKDEASWVGLGWNIQAGSITRQVNNLPDDFKDVTINETISSEKIHGWSHSISYNGATVGISYRSDQGKGGIIGFDMLSVINSPVSLTVTEGFGSAEGQSGVSLGIHAAGSVVQGEHFGLVVGASLSVGVSRDGGAYAASGAGISLANADSRNFSANTSASLASVGVSLSQKGGLSAGASVAAASMSTSVKGETRSESSGFFIPLYIPHIGLFTYSHSSWSTWIEGFQNDRYYGFLYADKQGMDCTEAIGNNNCHQPTNSSGQMRRHEFMEAQRALTSDVALDARLGKAAEDLYLVSAQGISGAVKPYRKEDGDYLHTLDATSKYICGIDFWEECGRRRVNRTERLEKYRNLLNQRENAVTQENGDVYWRYLDDVGGAEYTNPSTRDGYATVSMRSKKVVPKFDATGSISAFTITSANGTVYEFAFPLWNIYEKKEGFQEGSVDVTTGQEIDAVYTYAWLLTAIKTPDYVDLDGDGELGGRDIGGWVAFRYSDGDNALVANGKRQLQNWMTPYAVKNSGTPSWALYSPSPQTNGGTVSDGVAISTSRNRAWGMKTIAYLHTIETPTHLAFFRTKSGYREDNWPGQFNTLGYPNLSKALDHIVLVEKSTNSEVSYVEFETDYSLCQNTPNSRASTHGKLTLKSVRIGATSTGPFLPRYSFGYSNNPQFQSGSWVEYEKGEWDRWGNLCHTCSDSYHEPSVPFKSGRFDAGAWNLDRIVTPSGASLAIKYDAKRYQWIGADWIGAEWIGTQPYSWHLPSNTWQILVASGGPEGKETGPWPHLETYNTYLEYNIKLGNIRKKLTERGLTLSQFRFDITVEGDNTEQVILRTKAMDFDKQNLKDWKSATYPLTYTFNASQAPNDLWVDISCGNRGLKPVPDYRLYAIVTGGAASISEEDFAAGTVATEVKFREPFSNTIQTMQYKYEGGVTPSLPATFSDYNDARHRLGRGLEFFQGNPGVYYSKVTSTVNGKNKIEYQFLTPRNLPVMITSPSEVSPPSPKGGQLSTFTISDFSALWGSLYQKDEYSDGVSPTIVRSLKSIWAYNRKELPTKQANGLDGLVGGGWADALDVLEDHQEKSSSADYYISAKSSSLAKYFRYFGQHQSMASIRYFNKSGCYVGMEEGDCEQNIRTSQVVHKRFLPIQSREVATLDGLQTETFHYFPDFMTGRMLKRRVLNSDNSALVTWTVPAHQKYMTMEEKNSLEQDYSVSTYLYPPNARTGKAYNQEESDDNAIASTVTVWRPFDRNGGRIDASMTDFQAFRVFKTLQWRVDLNAVTRPILQDPDDYCNILPDLAVDCNGTLNGDPGASWFLKEQVNRYDAFGHATDVMDHRKINQTTLYGYRSSLPTAHVVNTGVPNHPADDKLRAFHESFELYGDVRKKFIGAYPSTQYSISEGNYKTGTKSLIVANNSPGTMVCFNLGSLEPSREYEASVWYFDATDGLSTTDPGATRPGIFLGENAGCASENHPNGVSGSAVAAPGSYNYASRATGGRKWKRLSTVIHADQCPDAAQLNPAMVCLYASKGNTGIPVTYDELRVRPGGSQMSTFAYDIRGNMVSAADMREVVTYYEYDPLGNLTGIRNDDGVIVSEQAKKIGKR